MSLTEHQFRRVVSDLLSHLADQLDTVESDDIDPVLSDGVLSCSFEELGGTFVLSQQVPVRELWLSANRTAWHFCYNGDNWPERDKGDDLLAVLNKLFSDKLSMPVTFTYAE